jgi:hypothetical protein
MSEKPEDMAGVSAEWIHTSENGKTGESPAIEVALDFMF